MQSRFLSNQRRQSCNSKQSLPKINKKVSKFEAESKTMVVKSLPKQSKSSSLSHSITVAIDNISQLISFLSSAKIQPDKENSIIDSLKSYLLQLKQHLKTNLIVIKPTKNDKNQLSNLKLNVYSKSNDISKIKNLNTQKYRNKILTPIQNYSGLMNQKISNKIQNKIHKTPYFNKALFPNLQQIESKKVNKQQNMSQNIKKSNYHEIKLVQKVQQRQKKEQKSISFKPQLQERKLIRVNSQIQKVKTEIQRDEKSCIKQQQIKKVDPIQIIEKLKFKISSHESLIKKLKNKLNQFENAALKQNKPIHKNQQNVKKIQTNPKQNIKQDSQILKAKQNDNQKNCQQKSQLDVLKTQLKARQQEIMSLWTLIQSTQHSFYPVN